MTDTTESTPGLNRAAAIAALILGHTVGDEGPALTPVITPTGRTVYAGGDNDRLLVMDASLFYRVPDINPPVFQRAMAIVGDIVQLDDEQTERLTRLDAVIDISDLDDVTAVPNDAVWSDELLADAKAADLVAYVAQHPDERPRVRALEEQRKDKEQRSTVLKATEPTPVEDEDAKTIAAGRADQSTTPTPPVPEDPAAPVETVTNPTTAAPVVDEPLGDPVESEEDKAQREAAEALAALGQ